MWEKGKINHVGFKASDDINLWKIELNKNIIPFIVGLIIGNKAIPIIWHIFYLFIIITILYVFNFSLK
mgnify:CR=1 FL=1